MSLTGQLDVRDSPVGRFFRERFRHTRVPLGKVKESLRVSPIDRLPEGTPSYVYGYIGTAIDYRIRYHLAHTPWTELAATKGAGLVSFRHGEGSDNPTTYVPANPIYRIDGVPPEAIDESARDLLARHLGVPPQDVIRPTRIDIGPLPGGRVTHHSIGSIGSTTWVPEDPVVPGFFEALDQAVAKIAPHLRIPDEAEERTLARFCITLAAFEAPYRAGPFNAWPPPYFEGIMPESVADLLALVPERLG